MENWFAIQIWKTWYRKQYVQYYYKNQFENTLGKVHLNTRICNPNFFCMNKGVRQGDAISPTLFNIFINDIGKIFELEQNCNDPLELTESKIGSLLFADDLIILSKSRTGLQNSLDNLSEYCDKWQLTVNVKKSKTMILQNNFVKFKDNFLKNVKEYKLVLILNQQKNAKQLIKEVKQYTS